MYTKQCSHCGAGMDIEYEGICYSCDKDIAVKKPALNIETKLSNLIEELYEDIKAMTPPDGFSSPRDLALVTEVNKKGAILNHLQEGMRVMVPGYEIKG